jgi:peptidoglycan/xylan/chitin deacetylase (PgdA/CDA1 family)
MTARDFAREAAYRLLYSVGGSGNGIALILLYHSVGTKVPHSIPAPIFKRQMETLAKRFQVVRLCALDGEIAKSAKANIASITFDDGYQDNYEVALPILERMGFQATFFVTTGFLGKFFPTSAGQYPMMTEAHVRQLAALGHEVGAHTITHPKLTKVSLTMAKAEVNGSKEFLEDLLGCPVVSFAYPKGDYNETVKELVRQSGFLFAPTVRAGLVGSHPDWLALPRVWVSGRLSVRGFEARISPAIEQYEYFRNKLWLS